LLRVAVQNSLFTCRDDHFRMGVDIGLAVGSANDSADIRPFLWSAEAACRQARRRGHNSIHIHRGE
jgi:GGDEF domain-containing protein